MFLVLKKVFFPPPLQVFYHQFPATGIIGDPVLLFVGVSKIRQLFPVLVSSSCTLKGEREREKKN